MSAQDKVATITLKRTIPVNNGLGECILWDTRYERVLWTDVPGRTLHEYDPSTGSVRRLTFAEDLCSFAFIDGSDDLLGAFQSGFALIDRTTGEYEWLHRIADSDEIRLNDGRVDRQGRFWCGSLMVDDKASLSSGPTGELLCVDADGTVSKHLDGIRISNSICWSPDGATMYFADTACAKIDQFDVDPATGIISNRRLFARTPESCGPDGSVVDADGFLWNAEWGAGRVVRYATDGSVDTVLQLPVSHVTCLTFGGPDLSELFVTTATYGLSAQRLTAEPHAGDVFVYETPFRGLPEDRYRRNP